MRERSSPPVHPRALASSPSYQRLIFIDFKVDSDGGDGHPQACVREWRAVWLTRARDAKLGAGPGRRRQPASSFGLGRPGGEGSDSVAAAAVGAAAGVKPRGAARPGRRARSFSWLAGPGADAGACRPNAPARWLRLALLGGRVAADAPLSSLCVAVSRQMPLPRRRQRLMPASRAAGRRSV